MTTREEEAWLLGACVVVAGGGTFWSDGILSVTETVLSIAFGLAALALMAAVARMRANITGAQSTIADLRQQIATDGRVNQLQAELIAAKREALELTTKLERQKTADNIDALIKLYAKKLQMTRQQIQIEQQRLTRVQLTTDVTSELKLKYGHGAGAGGGGGGDDADDTLNTTLAVEAEQLNQTQKAYIDAANGAVDLDISGIDAGVVPPAAEALDTAAGKLNKQGTILASLEEVCDPFGDVRSALSALKEANHMAGSEGELKVDLALTEFSLIEDEAAPHLREELGYGDKQKAWSSIIQPSTTTGGGEVFEATNVLLNGIA